MQPIRAAALAAICAGLFACAQPPPPPPPTPALSPAKAAPVDGTYRGTSTRFQADSRRCPHPGLVDIVVWQNRFEYHWDYHVDVDATIAADNTIEGTGPGLTLRGRRQGTTIDGDITNGTCGLHFTLRQVD